MELSDKVVEAFPQPGTQNKNLLSRLKEKLTEAYSNFMSIFNKKNKTAEYITVDRDSTKQEPLPKKKRIFNVFGSSGQIRPSALLIRGSQKKEQQGHSK